MKQGLALALAAAMALSLAGCGGAPASQPVSTPASASQPTGASQPESQPTSVSQPAGEAAQENYFEQHDIPLLDAPSEFEVHEVAYNNEDNTVQRAVPARVSAQAVVGDSEKEGYKRVALYVTITCSGFTYNDQGGLDESLVYNSGVYDLYTGRALPMRGTSGDTAYDYSTTVDWNGTSYELYYSKNVQWQAMTPDGNDVYRICNQNWVFEVPEDYDGLVYASFDAMSYDVSSYSEEIDEGEYYADEDRNDKDYNPEGTVFFRFGDKTQ